VLCRLIAETPAPYDCELTRFTAVSDAQAQFEMDGVSPGRYLVLYDSGLEGFEAGLNRWANKTLHLGDGLWVVTHIFHEEEDGSYRYYLPKGATSHEFYLAFDSLTLMFSGSPFIVAHDMRAASAYTGKLEPWDELPAGLFVPVVVQVVNGYTSQVEFDVLYLGK
jgi:hypothetical protein